MAVVARARRLLDEARASPLSRRVRRERLTYLSARKLATLERAYADVAGVPGGVIEAGVALGGSTVVLATRARADGRRFDGYDVFGQIPAPGDRDPPEVHERYATIVAGKSRGIAGDEYYGYRADLLEHVTATLGRYRVPVGDGVQLHQGVFEDTLHPAWPVALAHVDCDWHDPVALCLERLGAVLSPGGRIVIDDYHDYGGARTATDAFLARRDDVTIVADRGSVVLGRRR